MDQDILINDAYTDLLEDESRYTLLKGGSGSGKSVFGTQKIMKRMLTEKGHAFLGIRKVADTLKTSLFAEFKKRIKEFKVKHEFVINKTEKTFLHKPSGNMIILKGLDDAEKIKSITGDEVNITGIIIEEGTELTEEEFDQLDIRLRGNTSHYKQIIVMFNPVDEKHWIRKRFFPEESDDVKLYKYTIEKKNPDTGKVVKLGVALSQTTYYDNLFLDEEYFAVLESKAATSPNFYRIYKLGKWGKAEVKRPYCSNFNKDKHVSAKAVFNPKLDVYARFDFNVDPFVGHFGHKWTDREGEHWHIFKTIAMNNGDVYKMCEAIRQSFDKVVLSNMYFTGDAMQRKREITQRNNIDAWKIMETELNINSTRLQVPRANPSVKENRHLVNAVLALHPDYKIHPSCTLLISEMQFTEVDEEGNIIKKNRKNEAERADALDAERYAINAWLPDFIERNRR